ncbi:hypothetical protein VNO77_01935 [Canavalia gladiata]|uniref:Uncharacterized protein n=1 Tax=Canavalia gladiata TaxID=3824 RepID=A0AAN9MU23_CANGL
MRGETNPRGEGFKDQKAKGDQVVEATKSGKGAKGDSMVCVTNGAKGEGVTTIVVDLYGSNEGCLMTMDGFEVKGDLGSEDGDQVIDTGSEADDNEGDNIATEKVQSKGRENKRIRKKDVDERTTVGGEKGVQTRRWEKRTRKEDANEGYIVKGVEIRRGKKRIRKEYIDEEAIVGYGEGVETRKRKKKKDYKGR